jgi:hypothetical protein
MRCEEFKIWLKLQPHSDGTDDSVARGHAQVCPTCDRLLRLDQAAEQALRTGLSRVEVPSDLQVNVKLLAVKNSKEKVEPVWRRMVMPGVVFASLLLALMLLHPFSTRLNSFEQIAMLAEKDHLAGYAMEFRADRVNDISDWYRSKLDFEVRLPDLTNRGLKLLGGRKCTLGGKDVAYLFYDKAGKRSSLFELDARDVKIDMTDGKIYRYPIHDFVVEMWKEENRVYVLLS